MMKENEQRYNKNGIRQIGSKNGRDIKKFRERDEEVRQGRQHGKNDRRSTPGSSDICFLSKKRHQGRRPEEV